MPTFTDPESIEWYRYPVLAENPHGKQWIKSEALLGLAPNTIDAYARGVNDFLEFCQRADVNLLTASKGDLARYVGDLRQRPGPQKTPQDLLGESSHLSNATLQQRITAVRLFFDFLVEEHMREENPVGRGRYTPGKAFGSRQERALIPKWQTLPWIPSDPQGQAFLVAAQSESIRTRCMVALAYDAALRREELCSLQSDDVDPTHRMLRLRAETTKGHRQRTVPYSTTSGELLRAYLAHRRTIAQTRGPLFLPEGKTQADAKTVCLLDIPVHKTGHAFTKPVDALVGEAILAWEKIRPEQPQMIDGKTGEATHFLFCYRAYRLRKEYLNLCLIPTLCQKAGVPRTDACGSISSHRARSTIASQLFNAREPMTLFELQAWLGHQSPATTQHYVSTSPTKLTQAYKDAGYFSRNVRAIEVLIDRDAITSEAAANGSPWRYYDLGHGWCSYEFFDQCPQRMACARCDFYVPKTSDHGRWLQTRDSLLKMLQEIPLSDEERAAVDGDIEALNRLLERLKEVPPPSKTQQNTSSQSIIAVEQVRRFEDHRGEKERVR